MDSDQINDTELEALFEGIRATPPDVPDALMARVVADAVQLQPGLPIWQRVWTTLGGMPGFGGLVTATCVGVWLGVSPPATVPDLAGMVMGFEATSVEDFDVGGMSGFGWDIEEG